MARTRDMELHGQPRHESRVDGYTSPDEYAGQGDDRMIRDLLFSYTTAFEDVAGMQVVEPLEARRDEVVTLDQIGLIALEKGERLHSFYTTEERDRVEQGGSPDRPLAQTGAAVKDLGEYELAEYIKGDNPSGKKLTVQQVIDLSENDPDLANRLLAAENIATDGDPRAGVEEGLNSIISQG